MIEVPNRALTLIAKALVQKAKADDPTAKPESSASASTQKVSEGHDHLTNEPPK